MKFPAEQVRAGGWIAAIYKAIRYYDVDDPAFDHFEATITSGKTAEFLSSIRALGKVDHQQYEVYRKLARLKPRQATEVLQELEKDGLVEVAWDISGDPVAIDSITCKVTSRADVLGASAKLFESSSPTARSRAAIYALDATVHFPVPESRVIQQLTEKGFTALTAEQALNELVSLELLARTTETEAGQPLLYNPHVFRENAKDAYKVLSGLQSNDRDAALEVLEHVHKNPGVPFPQGTSKKVVALLTKAGIIDISGVQLKSGATQREFPTTPDIWGVFANGEDGGLSKDLIDDSKLLLNSLRYGQLYSSSGRGRISSPAVLVNALIDRGQVGPATAIGEDYPLPLARGIVNITESRLQPGRFFMELRKTDVAESVRDVLEQNVILPAGVMPAPEILQKGGGVFQPPDHTRMKRQLPSELLDARDSLAFELRTYRKRT
jgi:hypothetical protein